MPTIDFTKPEHNTMHYVNGAAKFIQAQFLPETVTSRQRLNTCLGCDFYSENSRNADTGKKICRLCRCPALEKSKIADVKKDEKCPMNYWNV